MPVPFSVIASVALGTLTADPVTVRETVSPFAVKFTLLAKLPTVVERRRTITVRLALGASDNEPPETTLKGAPTLAVPVKLEPVVFCTVNVVSTAAPTVVLPRLTAPAGLTLRSARAASSPPRNSCSHCRRGRRR